MNLTYSCCLPSATKFQVRSFTFCFSEACNFSGKAGFLPFVPLFDPSGALAAPLAQAPLAHVNALTTIDGAHRLDGLQHEHKPLDLILDRGALREVLGSPKGYD